MLNTTATLYKFRFVHFGGKLVFNWIIMNRQCISVVFAVLVAAIVSVHGASLSKSMEDHQDEKDTSSREGKTLGLLTAGASALSSGVGTAGKVLGTAVGVMSAIKPLIMLGVGKYYLWKWLQENNPGVPAIPNLGHAGFAVNAGNFGHAGFNINAGGNPSDYYVVPSSDDFYTVQSYEGPSYYVDTPSSYTKETSHTWGSSKKR